MRRWMLACLMAGLPGLPGPVRAQTADPEPAPAAEAEPAVEPPGPVTPPRNLEILSGNPGTGSVSLSPTPDLQRGLSEGDFMLFLLGRVSPPFGGSPEESSEMVAQEIIDPGDLSARIELFRDARERPLPGLYTLDLFPARNGLPSNHLLGRAWIPMGTIPEWIESFDAERKTAARILAEWRGGGSEEDEQALTEAIGMRYFNSLRELRDVFNAEDQDAVLTRAEAERKEGKPVQAPADGGLPPYADGGDGPDDVKPSGSGPGEGKKADGVPEGKPAPPRDRTAALEKVRDRFAGETLSHLTLAAEGLCWKAGWPEAPDRWSVPDRMMLREYADRLTGEDPRLKMICQAENLSGFWNKLSAGSEGSPPEPEVLNGLIRRAREIRARVKPRT